MTGDDRFVRVLRKWMGAFMHHSMRNFIRYAKENGLSLSQCGVLFHLHHLGSAGVSDLGDRLGVSSAAVSQMLDRLVQQDLILRAEDPSDRRGKQIELTENGSRVLEDGFRARESWVIDLAQCLSATEKEQVVQALNTLIEKADELRSPNLSDH